MDSPRLRATAESYPLVLNQPFRIAHGTSVERHNALVRFGEGVGEAGLPPYLDTDFAAVEAWISSLPELESAPRSLRHTLSELPAGPQAARCALDLALHDHWGRTLDAPLHDLLGVDPSRAPRSFVTLSIQDDIGRVPEAVSALGKRTPVKVKVGSGDFEQDLRVIEAVCGASSESVCVDANGAWSIPDAVRAIPRCQAWGVTVLEQPIAPGDPDDWHLMMRLLHPGPRPALVADESVFDAADVIALAGAADGINIKLAKCGGIQGSLEMIGLARALDLKVMVGCMVESRVAIAAAACLAPLADFVDLDGILMLRDDPFEGIEFEEGRIVFSGGHSGLGVRERP